MEMTLPIKPKWNELISDLFNVYQLNDKPMCVFPCLVNLRKGADKNNSGDSEKWHIV